MTDKIQLCITGIKYILKCIKTNVILNCKKKSQYYWFYCIFTEINPVLVGKRLQKTSKHFTDPKHLNGSVYNLSAYNLNIVLFYIKLFHFTCNLLQ